MSKRIFPSLDGLDAGERPVLGIRETHDLADLRVPLGDGFTYDDQAPAAGIASLFDSYDD
ncbi:hypothetical protein OG879_31515 [Streptomyces caniferus]|uniref:hypothetical protein n=1 Tax=Streptomyces caniferus TaxID=285557 RepID=UPI002E29266A|nr:hypothetical protein [Streptomyces caniferus]